MSDFIIRPTGRVPFWCCIRLPSSRSYHRSTWACHGTTRLPPCSWRCRVASSASQLACTTSRLNAPITTWLIIVPMGVVKGRLSPTVTVYCHAHEFRVNPVRNVQWTEWGYALGGNRQVSVYVQVSLMALYFSTHLDRHVRAATVIGRSVCLSVCLSVTLVIHS